MTPVRRLAATILLVSAAAAVAADAELAPAPTKVTALVGAMIRTQTDAGDFVGNVLIEDGKVTAVGPNVIIPSDAHRVDLRNCVITPGLIDAHSVLWLNPAAARETGSTGNLNILDGVDPFAEDWRDVARQGVTAVYVQPASGDRFGGSGAVLRVGPASSVDDVVLRSPAGVQATLGVAAAAAPPQQDDRLAQLAARLGIQLPTQPAQQQAPASNSLTRFAQYEAFHGLFEAAKRAGPPKRGERDLGRELLQLAMKREVPVRLETAHEDDLQNLVKLTIDFGLRTVFERLDRVKILPEVMNGRKDGLVLGPFVGGSKSADVRRLALDGRPLAFGTYGDDPQTTAMLRLHAAAAIADGYPRDRILRALTHDAAEMHGVGAKLGSIAAGRVADLAIFAGDPLDPSVPVRMTICQGSVTYENPNAEHVPVVAEAKPAVPDVLPSSYVIRTTKLLNEAGEFAPGELFVTGGRVSVRVSSNGAPVIDVGDAPVTPGLVAARVSVGGEMFPDADAGHLRAADALLVDRGAIRAFRDAGFTTTVVVPGSANVIAGRPAHVRTGDSDPAADAGVHFVLSPSSRSDQRYPASLVGQIELIGDRLRGVPAHTDLYLPPPVAKALLAQRDEALAGVRAGRSPAYFEAHTRAEVRAALRLIGEFKLRGVIVEPKQLDDVADEVRAAGVAVVAAPAKPQDGEKARRALADLGQAGVPLAFGGGDPADVRNTAALLVNAGLGRPAARRGLVGVPAQRFGLPADTGRLALGDRADFVVWDGDPLDPAAKPVAVVVRGQRIGRGS
jgi:imidazolonepropionase-like amidohydrolase